MEKNFSHTVFLCNVLCCVVDKPVNRKTRFPKKGINLKEYCLAPRTGGLVCYMPLRRKVGFEREIPAMLKPVCLIFSWCIIYCS